MFLSALPALLALALAILSLASKHIHGLEHFMPILPMIPVFYWGMAHAREMPYWFVFLLGLIMDAVMGVYMGTSSLLYMIFLFMLHAQRKYIHKEGFAIKWLYFAILLAAMCALNWIILSLFNAHSEVLTPAFLQWLLTVCCYPIMHKAFDSISDYMQSRRWQILHGS